MKALFLCKGELRYLYPLIAAKLKAQYGWSCDAVTFNTPSVEFVRRYGAFDRVFNLAEHLKRFYARTDPAASIARLEEFERQTGESVYTMLYSDRILRTYPFERAVRLFAGTYDFWQTVLPDAAPDVVYAEVASASEWLAWALCRRQGIRYLMVYPTPVSDRFYFLDDPIGEWESMRRAYFALRDADVPPDRLKRAEEWLAEFHRTKPKAPYIAIWSHSPFHFNARGAVRRVGRIPFRVRTYVQDGFYEIGSYHGTHPLSSAAANVQSMYRHVLASAFAFRHKPPAGPYVYFPLHVQPEFTTDVRAPLFVNQVALAENMAKSLPAGYRLVVKEHPGMKGERPLAYYRALRRLFNVELVSPDVDGHDLILNAAAVAVITGHTAWEAILYQKPVIAFGPLCYGFFDLVHHCPDIRDFGRIVREAVDGFRPDRGLVLKLIAALLETAHDGTINAPTKWAVVTAPENIANVARAVVREMGEARPASLTKVN